MVPVRARALLTKVGTLQSPSQGQEIYHFCTCGECVNQPWTDSEDACRSRGFAPAVYIPRHSGTKFLCGCKHCGSKPLCNGTCYIAWMDYNIMPACSIFFGGCFIGGVILTWFFHP